MNGSKNRAVFLDRDGVVNKRTDGQYVVRWQDFQFIPGAAAAIRTLNQAGWLVIVVTNQSAVAKKLLSELELRQIHQNMVERLSGERAKIDAIYYCPHDAEDDCQCRKPKPGMVLQAAREHQVDLSASWIIGDSVVDMEAGKVAGCKTIWLRSASAADWIELEPDAIVESLAEAVAVILSAGSVRSGANSRAGGYR